MALTSNQKQAVTKFSAIGVAGLILLIMGLVMHGHNSSLASICSTGLGQLGQSVNPQAQAMCNHANVMSDIGSGSAVFGAIGLFYGGRSAYAVFARDARTKKMLASQRRPGASATSPTVIRQVAPSASVVVDQTPTPVVPSTVSAIQQCTSGHAVSDGQQFCNQCGEKL